MAAPARAARVMNCFVMVVVVVVWDLGICGGEERIWMRLVGK